MPWSTTIAGRTHVFADLRTLLAKATPLRSGDVLAGVAAESAEERVAAQYLLADLPLAHFLIDPLIPYEDDEVTRLIHDRQLICEVTDSSHTSPHLRYAATTDEGGRGLYLIAQLTQRWGTRYSPTSKTIWTEQALP